MNRSKDKDDKERYLTYSITVKHGDMDKGTQDGVVTKKMPKFTDGGTKEFLEWVYHFNQLAKMKEWSAEDKFRNARVLLEGDLLDQLDQQLIAGDDDVRMDDKEFNSALYKASVVVMPVFHYIGGQTKFH
ncbi:hypothetical protein PHYSODRAFT_246297 [Phytophthora sojae]|uniref:Uncharacterized protein n=1 Tax=Phytophthora sojae (strain P6497) TaxID=1094619 RepID=G4YJ46_PHYSP|nr:hypothetical protein PHYSODRAFT_246297 [Phytophthora sojae]EGZ29186.1 hypothetical protein PHYSODRAFT_246297 [Phytophthora sojae]|eukprot:XP_009516461.1 hypothetical protein PHYSODRAFT_246297 [Phytophthora sojae]